MSLVKLKSGPSSSRWDFVDVKGDYRFWRARSGKLYAQRGVGTNAEWFKVVNTPAPSATPSA